MMFKEVYPRSEAEGGIYDESVTSSWKALTASRILSTGAMMVCNTHASDWIYYSLGGTPSSATGLVLLPGETLWIWNRQGIDGFRFRSLSGGQKLAVQLFDNSCE